MCERGVSVSVSASVRRDCARASEEFCACMRKNERVRERGKEKGCACMFTSTTTV